MCISIPICSNRISKTILQMSKTTFDAWTGKEIVSLKKREMQPKIMDGSWKANQSEILTVLGFF